MQTLQTSPDLKYRRSTYSSVHSNSPIIPSCASYPRLFIINFFINNFTVIRAKDHQPGKKLSLSNIS